MTIPGWFEYRDASRNMETRYVRLSEIVEITLPIPEQGPNIFFWLRGEKERREASNWTTHHDKDALIAAVTEASAGRGQRQAWIQDAARAIQTCAAELAEPKLPRACLLPHIGRSGPNPVTKKRRAELQQLRDALRAWQDDYGIGCYCSQLIRPGKCAFCLTAACQIPQAIKPSAEFQELLLNHVPPHPTPGE